MTDHVLRDRFNKIRRRLELLRLTAGLGLIWILAACVGVCVLWLSTRHDSAFATVLSTAITPLVVIASAASFVWIVWVLARRADDRIIARKVEAQFPSLDTALMTAVEQQPVEGAELGYLQSEVVARAREHGRRNDWKAVVPTWRLTAAGAMNAVGLFVVSLVIGAAVLQPTPATSSVASPLSVPSEVPAIKFEVVVEPGDVEVERGTSLLVMARFPERIPETATLESTRSGKPEPNEPETGEPETGENDVDVVVTTLMERSLDDPVFAARIDRVDKPMTYAIRFGEQVSDRYQVTVFEYPRLERADATLVFPEYTKRDVRVVEDVRRLTALKGTQITLDFLLNKSIASATLTPESGRPIPLSVSTDEPTARFQTTVERSSRYRLVLTDAKGRTNKTSPLFVINVVDNIAPKLKLVKPKSDLSVSPLEEVDLHATVWDDFEVAAAGLSYSFAGAEQIEIELGSNIPAKKTVGLKHRLFLENLAAAPDQLMSYYFWADDVDSAGKTRRTMGDMHFAEVRPFEEVYRQGSPPPGGPPPPQAKESEKLAELQKKIINAAWTVVRRENDRQTSKLASDSAALAESQELAIAQLNELMAELGDPKSQRYAADALEAMESARQKFTSTGEQKSLDDLRQGLSSAQLAYQGLLRLRAREHEIVRAKAAHGSGQSQQKSEMNNLELEEDENRYETQSAPTPEEEAATREDRQILNRLRELARRQNDVNARIKELQTALEDAKTEEEKAEIERRLKRLREEQQEILRDTEELAQRMDQEENQERMNSEREQLEQARQNARQASEALKEGQVSRAAAEGTRAEETFRDLKDEFQKGTSQALAEQVQQLAEQADQTIQEEQELANQLDKPAEKTDSRPSLRSTPNDIDDSLAEKFEEQRERIADLTESMRKTIDDAEAAEQPLLAEKLYEAIRSTRTRRPEEALTRAEQSLQRGFADDAKKLEEIASEGLETLREGIDSAGSSLLEDEADALRRAQTALKQLRNELAGEAERNDPQSKGANALDGSPSENESASENARTTQASDDADSKKSGARGKGQESSENGEEGTQESEQPSQSKESGSGQGKGEKPGEKPGLGSGEGGSGEGAGQKPSDTKSDSEGSGEGSGEGHGEGQKNGRGTGGLQAGAGQSQKGSRSLRPSATSPGRQRQQSGVGGANFGGGEQAGVMPQTGRSASPLTGDDYLDWSDRLRDVEEMLSDPELRAEAAAIRDRAKSIRKDIRRHSSPPEWDVVREMVVDPLTILERRVRTELLRKSSEKLVPIDRSPVPPEFESHVRRYYERLGVGD